MIPKDKREKLEKQFRNRFSSKVPVAVRIYYLHSLFMLIFSVWMLITNGAVSDSPAHTVAVAVLSAALFALGVYAFLSKYNYPLAVVSNLALIFFVFPSIFFTSAGLYGGGLFLFIFGIFLLTIIIRRPLSYYLVIVLFVWYTGCVLLAAYRPETVHYLDFSSGTVNIVATFFVAALMLFCMLRMIVTGYNREHRQLEILNDKLNMELITDDLTEIANHRLIKNEIIRALSQADETSRIYLCMYDIDDFKLVNDAYGHMAGNDILYDFAQLMKRELGDGGICARYGGEEFMMLIEDKSPEEVFEIAEGIRKHAEKELFVPGTRQNVTVSCGIAKYEIGCDAEAFAKTVDDRMYRAKHKGKNQTVFY